MVNAQALFIIKILYNIFTIFLYNNHDVIGGKKVILVNQKKLKNLPY